MNKKLLSVLSSTTTKNTSKWVNYLLIGVVLFFGWKIYQYFKGDLHSSFSPNGFKDNPFVAGNSTNQINTKASLKKLCDEVVQALGSKENWFGQYDDATVNRLANLSKSDLIILLDYYNLRYRQVTGKTLYNWIDSEFDYVLFDSNFYDPARKIFKKYKLTYY